MKMCGVDDCPKTHDKIIAQLCDLHYPYGGVVCRNQFLMWYGQEEQVRQLHDEYLKAIGQKDNVVEIKSDKCKNCGHRLKAEYKFCPKCGFDIEADGDCRRYICPTCRNEEHPADAKFCKICGTLIKEDT